VVHGERVVYDSPWLRVGLADVTAPGGLRFPEHHVVRAPAAVAGCLVHDPDTDRLLMLHRHRFATDTWGWEVPAGRLEPGALPPDGAVREAEEETGWRPLRPLALLAAFAPSPGLLDQLFHAYSASGAYHVGEPVDAHESTEVAWLPVGDVVRLVEAGEVRESLSLVAVHSWLRRVGR
jgi:8-oxo-dGTP pyrophosphatase MutT (NUDIX family)